MKTYKTAIVLLLIYLAMPGRANAQVTIVSANLSEFNIGPSTLCQVNLNSSQTDATVILDATLMNGAGEILLKVKTQPIKLHQGMNSAATLHISFLSTEFGISPQATYLQNHHSLPSGQFKHCIQVVTLSNEYSDDFCQDLSSQANSFLYLVFPFDKDFIDTKYPLLSWAHGESFAVLAPGEYFRVIVAELNRNQDAEAGVTSNTPVFLKDMITSHQIQYPMDSKELIVGKRYGWQIQRISNGSIIDKTESWEFTIKQNTVTKENKYASLKRKIDGGFYTTENRKLYFKFDEVYSGNTLNCKIYDDKRKVIEPIVDNEDKKNLNQSSSNVKLQGYNRYEIDLDDFGIKKGFYTLEVKNEKSELYILKFYVE